MSMKKREEQLAKDFGSFFRAERKRHNLTQIELSKVIGVSQSRMSKIEQGTLVLNVFEFFAFAKKVGLRDLSRFLKAEATLGK